MYILYLDESGTHGEASCFVLAGLAVFEREIHWFTQDLDQLQSEYFPDETKPVHFHAAQLRTSASDKVVEPWGRLTTAQKRELKDKIIDIIRNRRGVLFGCVIDKRFAQLRGHDPYELAFEDLISRFDLFLSRTNSRAENEKREEQRGLVVLAESSYEKTIALLASRIRERGTRWGSLHNVTDVPYFAPARDTRLLQYADFCSNVIYGRFHSGQARDFDRIAIKLDQEGSALHGLVHLCLDSSCFCPACQSRRAR